MARDFVDLVKRLLPRGPVWRAEGRIGEYAAGQAVDLGRTDGRFGQIFTEADVRTATETLGEWETVYGLPEPCGGTIPATDADRRLALAAKASATGGQSRAYFVAVAAAAGFTVTITEYTDDVFLCGVSTCGDSLYGKAWAFHWEVVSSSGVMPDWLRCQFERYKPAHTTVSFTEV